MLSSCLMLSRRMKEEIYLAPLTNKLQDCSGMQWECAATGVMLWEVWYLSLSGKRRDISQKESFLADFFTGDSQARGSRSANPGFWQLVSDWRDSGCGLWKLGSGLSIIRSTTKTIVCGLPVNSA